MTDWAKELAADIVLQAYKDFRRYAREYKRSGDKRYIAEMKDIVDFVKSDWFKALTDIPQEKFLKKLMEVVEK